MLAVKLKRKLWTKESIAASVKSMNDGMEAVKSNTYKLG